METYKALRERQRNEVDMFPLGAAFDQKQFDEMMIKFGYKPNETEKICSLGAGVFIRECDVDSFKSMMQRHGSELRKAMETDVEFAYDSFITEMFNHECGYTGNFSEAIMALGLSLSEICSNKILSSAYDKARNYALACA